MIAFNRKETGLTQLHPNNESRFCIIGSAGFIGARLTYQLIESGCTITTVDIEKQLESPDHHQADVSNSDFLDNALNLCHFDTVFNLAAAHRDDIRPNSIYHDVNVNGARNVCALAEKTGAKQIIFTSSVAVYGFAPPNTDEDGELNPFNEYGRTKAEAELVYREWQAKEPLLRSLVIVRPTVVFGSGNRGNVYNLVRQVANGFFVMIGSGRNVKSMAAVDNVVAFLRHCLGFGAGVHVYNYVDKPDFDMNTLVAVVRESLGMSVYIYLRLPRSAGMFLGRCADLTATFLGRNLPISSIRIEKFCATTQFSSRAAATGFRAPVPLDHAIRDMVKVEFGQGSSQEKCIKASKDSA